MKLITDIPENAKVLNCSVLRFNNIVFEPSATAIPGQPPMHLLSFDSVIFDNIKELYLSREGCVVVL